MHFEPPSHHLLNDKEAASRNFRSRLLPYDRISQRLVDQHGSLGIPLPNSAAASLCENLS